MTPRETPSAAPYEPKSRETVWRRAVLAMGLVLALAAPVSAAPADSILLTSGVVTAVDQAQGVVELSSGWTLRVRRVIVNDQVQDISAIRVDDVIFVSGSVLKGPDATPKPGASLNGNVTRPWSSGSPPAATAVGGQ